MDKRAAKRRAAGASFLLICGALAAPILSAQQVTPPPGTPPKSRGTAVVLGLILPGAAHWYAGEHGRGLAVAAVYVTGLIILGDGRTDTRGKIGGGLAVGAVGYSMIDGVLAVGRYNARLMVTPAQQPGGLAARVGFTLTRPREPTLTRP